MTDASNKIVWLDELDLTNGRQDWGTMRANTSVTGEPLRIAGITFQRGIGTHASSEIYIDLKSGAALFEAAVGVDESAGERGTVSFEVWLDDEKAADTGIMRGSQELQNICVDLTGAKILALIVTDDGDGHCCDQANWAEARITIKDGAEAPVTIPKPYYPPIPIARGVDPEPRINGPKIVGATPGRDFLFLIPATGDGPLKYAAEGLPDGLTLDENTGIVTGSLSSEGEWTVNLTVTGAKGKAERVLKIVGGEHKLALTPPLGWNSWNVWAEAVDDAKVRAAADALVSTGLAASGYQFINIDDCWEGGRDADGNITSNQKFPDMKALSDYVHSKGLKLGIYSSPGPLTCAKYEGSYEHEFQDAKTWASWGIDYLKHDWCSYWKIAKDNSREELMKPYLVMREALDRCGRDIVYSLCQYGMGQVWEWGQEVGANCWRTTGDIRDSWSSVSVIGFSQNGLERYAGPGHWNDPDMMVVGKVGWGPYVRPTQLTPNEQILHMTLWTILASPILLGCDLSDIDDWTLDLLRNPEVIDVHQDPLGKQGYRRSMDGETEVWARDLEDGGLAVGLFNRSRKEQAVTVQFSGLGISGSKKVRDIWQRKDLGVFEQEFGADVPPHGAVFVKIY